MPALIAGTLSSLLASANPRSVDKPQARMSFYSNAARIAANLIDESGDEISRAQVAAARGSIDPMSGYFFQLVMSSTLTSYFAIFATASFWASSSMLLKASASL